MSEEPGDELPGVDLAAVLNRVNDAVLSMDERWRITFANAAAEQLLGRTLEDLLGKNVWTEFPQSLGGVFDREYHYAMSSQHMVAFETPYAPVGGQLAVRAYPAPDGITTIFRDITPRVRLEDERRRAVESTRVARIQLRQFRALVEDSTDFIAIAGLDRRLIYLNRGGRRLIGLPDDADITALGAPDLLTARSFEHYLAVEAPATAKDGQWTGERWLRHHGGGPPIPVTATVFGIRDPETHETVALATIQRDISSRIAAETELRELADLRRELLDRLIDTEERERARIAADVHDDSVQAIAAVDLRLGILARKLADAAPELDAMVKTLQQTVTAASERLRALLFDLEPAGEDETLVEAVRGAAAYIFADSAIRWTLGGDPGADLQPTERGQAVRIVKEALTNARNHAGASTVQITIAARPDEVELAIADDGAGLDPDSATSPRGHRGLATMRDRAEITGGWWRLERGDAGGTVVRFALPIARVRPAPRIPPGRQ